MSESKTAKFAMSDNPKTVPGSRILTRDEKEMLGTKMITPQTTECKLSSGVERRPSKSDVAGSNPAACSNELAGACAASSGSSGAASTHTPEGKSQTAPCGCHGEWIGHNYHSTICAEHVKQLGEDYCKAHLRQSWVKSVRLQQREIPYGAF